MISYAGGRPRIAICSNTSWSLYNFRRGLIKDLLGHGFDVIAVAPIDDYASRLVDLGCRYVPLPMDNKGTSPMRDLGLLARFRRLLWRERPAIFLGYTIKPNVYGSLAAHSLGIPVINNVAGLGTAFSSSNALRVVAQLLYRLALARSRKVFFQNAADMQQFINSGIVSAVRCERLPGSGVDMAHFSAAPSRDPDGEVRFLLLARMLREKGIGEFVKAAREVRLTHPHARFQLLGFLDVLNPSAISRSTMQGWVDEGVVEYLGVADDVRPYIALADCVVLPSYYREGVPHSLLEAASMARPIITTDWSGCREVVDEEVSGLIVPPRDGAALAAACRRFLELSEGKRVAMGAAGRHKMAAEYDEQLVISRYRDEILNASATPKASGECRAD